MQRLFNSILFRSMACATLITVLFLCLALGIKRHRLASFDLKVSEAVQSMRTPSLSTTIMARAISGSAPAINNVPNHPLGWRSYD